MKNISKNSRSGQLYWLFTFFLLLLWFVCVLFGSGDGAIFTRGMNEVNVDFPLIYFLRVGSNESFFYFSIGGKKYCWYGADSKLCCDIRIFINVYFQNFDVSVGIFSGELIHYWSNEPTRSTPISEKINNTDSGMRNFLLEMLFGVDMNYGGHWDRDSEIKWVPLYGVLWV